MSSDGRHPLLALRWPALVLATALLYGTLGYWLIEGWPPLDDLFMTVITITTVGYDVVHPLSVAGEVFTLTLILGGVGGMVYALGACIEVLTTGQLGRYRSRRIMEKRIRSLRDHFIVCGYGRMGSQVIRELEREGATHIVVDHVPETIARLRREGRPFIEGDAASEAVLRQAGIERARGLISTVDSDERGVYIVLAARALNPRLYVLARAGQPESVRRMQLAGADRVVSPYRMAGRQMAMMALHPALVEVVETLQHGGSEVAVEEVLVDDGCTAVGRTLAECGLFSPGQAQLLALRRRDGTLHVNPAHDLRLEAGDLVVALGSREQLEATAASIQ